MDGIKTKITEAAEKIRNAQTVAAFTGAGISVESGIPPFRGEGGLWNKYDPKFIEINYFLHNPVESWSLIKEIFYDFFGKAKYNTAHHVLAKMEEQRMLKAVITQNIDNLHQESGSKVVHEFHGNSKHLVCTECSARYNIEEVDINTLPPFCKKCDHLLKPDFIFFGEAIPQSAYLASIELANIADVFIVIGSTGEIMPACQIPVFAKTNGSIIIEINKEKSNFTDRITDIFLQGKATEIMRMLGEELFNYKN
jgi:NAD-dependent deacetylase